LPEIGPGVGGSGFTVTANVLALLEPQALTAATDTFPLWAEVLKLTDIDVPEAEPLIDQPDGTVQLYEVAPETAAIL